MCILYWLLKTKGRGGNTLIKKGKSFIILIFIHFDTTLTLTYDFFFCISAQENELDPELLELDDEAIHQELQPLEEEGLKEEDDDVNGEAGGNEETEQIRNEIEGEDAIKAENEEGQLNEKVL